MTKSIAIIGGTGRMGSALASQLVSNGRQVLIGSRHPPSPTPDAVHVSCASDRPESPAVVVSDLQAAEACEVIIVTVPFAAIAELGHLAAVADGKLVISTVNRLGVRNGTVVSLPSPRSAAEELAHLLPRSRVVAAFNHVSAVGLAKVGNALQGDVLVCADDPNDFAAAEEVIRDVATLGTRHVGPLALAGAVEDFAAVIVGLNRGAGHRLVLKMFSEGVVQ